MTFNKELFLGGLTSESHNQDKLALKISQKIQDNRYVESTYKRSRGKDELYFYTDCELSVFHITRPYTGYHRETAPPDSLPAHCLQNKDQGSYQIS